MTGEPGGLYGELFADGEMAALLGDAAALQGMLDFEAALARAEAQVGVIPATAAEAIAAACEAGRYDVAALGRAATLAGNPAIPLVKALTAQVAATDAEAARWVHYGATSQDVIDSAHAQQYRAAADLVLRRTTRLADGLARLAADHRDTPMIGRTFLQHAVPIGFGVKAALWLEPLTTFLACAPADLRLPLQLAGAAGTLAALDGRAAAVQEAFRGLTGSTEAVLVPWHTARDRLALVAARLGILTGHLGKIAQDVALMAATEVAELAEPEAPGKGGSSAMPHKRNPVLCTLILAAAKRAPGLVATMLAALPQEHERALGGWHAEWRTMSELFAVTGAAARQATLLIEGLQVFPDRMRRNLEMTNGLVMAERVSLALAGALGRAQAHHLLEEASRECVASGRHLREVLARHPAVEGRLTAEELDRLFEPNTYRGATDAIIDRVLALHGATRAYATPDG